jgi:FHS family L-fucose permease-like MFS transporter
VQAFNTTGDVLAIIFGQQLILARTIGGTSLEGRQLTYAERIADAQATQLPYLIVAIVLAALAVAIALAKLPELGASTRRASAEARKGLSLWSHRNLILGCGAIALCVYAEISVSSLFINFSSQEQIANLTHTEAASYLAFFWGGMMVGRFAGAWIMRHLAAEKVLAVFALGGMACALVAVFVTGPVAMYALMVIGLFISIMFPTIFALSIRGLGPLTEEGSGWLIMSIAGGGLVFIQGRIADAYGLNWGFLLTALCCLYVFFYAVWGSKPTAALPPERANVTT